MADSKVYNVGIIGWGLSAQIFHIPFITMTPGLKLVGGVTSDPTKIPSTLKHYPTHAELIKDPTIDLVVVATPPNTHFDLTYQALTAGKHVVCEKPFVSCEKKAVQLEMLAKDQGKMLAVYQNRRWDADFLTVKALIEEGKLGRVYEFETHFDRYRPNPTDLVGGKRRWKEELSWNEGGGPLFDLGSHLIDQAVVLFGCPKEVWGRFRVERDAPGGDVEKAENDSIHAVLSYGSGLDVIVKLSTVSCEANQLRFWVKGNKGSYKKRGMDPQEDQLKAATEPTKEDVWSKPWFGQEGPGGMGTLCEVGQDGKVTEKGWPTVTPVTYKGFYEGMVKAMRSGKEGDVPVTAADAAVVLRVIEAIQRSAEGEGRVKVEGWAHQEVKNTFKNLKFFG